MKKLRKILPLVLTTIALVLSTQIFSDWDNFKRGLTGKPEIETQINE